MVYCFRKVDVIWVYLFILITDRVDERARRRRRKDREERRREIEIQRAEDAKWGRTKNQPIVRLDSKVHFPGFSPSPQDLPKVEEDAFVDMSPSSIEQGAQHGAGPSFAQVIFNISHVVCTHTDYSFTQTDVA